MPDYDDIVKRLRANLDKYPGFVNLNADAATAIETLLAQRAVLVAEVEAWRDARYYRESPSAMASIHERLDKARAATDAAFPEGMTK